MSCCKDNKPLKLEAGKTYLDEQGNSVHIFHKNLNVFIGDVCGNSNRPQAYDIDGRHLGIGMCHLVSEVIPPISYDVYVNVYPIEYTPPQSHKHISVALKHRGDDALETRKLNYTQGIGFTDKGVV